MSLPNVSGLEPAPTKHAKLIQWVRDIADLTQPDRVVWCDGSQAEWDRLTRELVAAGTLRQLNPKKRPNSFYAASDPRAAAEMFTNSNPMRQVGDMFDIGHAVVYLSAPSGKFITGEVLTVDGGRQQWGEDWPGGIPDYFRVPGR